MFNIFKKSEPIIEFWALQEGIEETAPIVPAKEILPEWWKKLSIKGVETTDTGLMAQFLGEKRTAKRCPAIIDFMTHGWVMTMWCDLVIKTIDGNMMFQYSLPGWDNAGSMHPNWQMIDHLPKDAPKYLGVFKPGTPWLVKTKPGYSTYHLDPFYFFNPNFDTAPGIQDSDLYHDLNPQMLIKKEEFIIPKGTPLQIIVPFKREEMKGAIVPVCEKTRWLNQKSHLISFSRFSSANSYNEYRNKKKQQCPFS